MYYYMHVLINLSLRCSAKPTIQPSRQIQSDGWDNTLPHDHVECLAKKKSLNTFE